MNDIQIIIEKYGISYIKNHMEEIYEEIYKNRVENLYEDDHTESICSVYPLKNVYIEYSKRDNSSIIEDLKRYFSKYRDTIVILNKSNIDSFCQYVYTEYEKTKHYNDEVIKLKMEKYKRYIYDKRVNKFVVINNVKEYRDVLKQFILDYMKTDKERFNDDIGGLRTGVILEKYHKEVINYVKENIIIGGTEYRSIDIYY